VSRPLQTEEASEEDLIGAVALEEYARSGVEPIDSEVLDDESSLATYEVLTYPADWTLEVLVDKWRKGQIAIPKFQRQFVWNQVQASKLIESFLLGLPVPAIFLYSDPDDPNLLVVDGQQRIKSIAYYFEGYFGEESLGRRPVFRLSGLDRKSPFSGLTYTELAVADPSAYAKLTDSVLRAFVIKQLNPADNTSIFLVFERLNTGGTVLSQQEIRNCIYEGPFNDLLLDLNNDLNWRSIFGKKRKDKRQRDVELILRFLALSFNAANYDRPMKNFLSDFMRENRRATEARQTEFASVFADTVAAIRSSLGPKPFHIRTGLNAAVFDAVSAAFSSHLGDIPADMDNRFDHLLADERFLELVSAHTTDKEVVEQRLLTTAKRLFG
jgi:hypothetical protein